MLPIRSSSRFVFLVAALLALSTARFEAENISKELAYHLPPDGTVMTGTVYFVSGGPTERWYVTTLKGGRSYNLQLLTDFSSPSSGKIGVAVHTSFDSSGVNPSPAFTSLNSTFHPQFFTFGGPQSATPLANTTGGNRFFYVSALPQNAEEPILIRVTPSFLSVSGEALSFRIAIQDTTLYCPWFYTDANYESYVTLQNTTSETIFFSVMFYQANTGTAVSGAGNVLTPFAGTYVAAKATSGAPVGSLGSVKITHTGPPGSLKANLTAVNTTGIGAHHSFNIPFAPQVEARPP